MINRSNAPDIIDAVRLQVELPPYEKHTLRNGTDLYAINMGTQDTLMITWIFYAGNWYEEKNLVAAATNHLLKNGTPSRNAFEINEQFEFYGAYLNRNCYNETAEIVLHGLTKHVSKLLPVIAELMSEAIFPEEELQIFKKNMQQRLQVNLKKNEFVANRLIEAYLFGEDHPYGKYSSLPDYDAVDRADLQAYFKEYYVHGRCLIIASGVLPDDLPKQLDDAFGGLPLNNTAMPQKEHILRPASQKKYRLSQESGAGVQGSIRMARPFPNRHHPDFPKMQVLNNIFGGFFGSRLMDNIREDKGYTYGINSYLPNHLKTSGLMISTEAGVDVCEAAISEIYKEMEALCTDLVPDDELQLTRNYLIGSVLGDLDGPFQLASRWKNYILNGLGAEHFYNNMNIIRTITPGELRDVAQRYLQPESFYELIVT